MTLESLLHAICIQQGFSTLAGQNSNIPRPMWALDVFQLTTPLTLFAWLFQALFYEWETHSEGLCRFLKLFLCVVLSSLVLCLENFSYSGIRPGSGWDYLPWNIVLKGSLGRNPRWFYILSCFLSLMDQKKITVSNILSSFLVVSVGKLGLVPVSLS